VEDAGFVWAPATVQTMAAMASKNQLFATKKRLPISQSLF
jgi:hypothetical protein